MPLWKHAQSPCVWWFLTFPLESTGLLVHPAWFSFCNYRHLALWSDVFSYVLLLTRNYHGLFFSSLFFHMEVRVIVSTFVESTTERRFLLKLHWIYRFIPFSWRLINLFITLGIAIHEYRMSPYLCL